MPYYEVNPIDEDSTIIQLQRLRLTITDENLSILKNHLQSTYAKFLKSKLLTIKLGLENLKSLTFENWSYPPDFLPHRYHGRIITPDFNPVEVEVIAGLSRPISKLNPAGGEYGVYFYCNDRLISRALKSYTVGFTTGLAGKPHDTISLVKVFVFLKGESQSMPWNSSKSEVDTKHPVFLAFRSWLVKVVKDYASLSRRLSGDWPQKVFKYSEGKIKSVKIDDFRTEKKSYLPPLPKSKPRYSDLGDLNKKIAEKKPWTIGLYEGVVAVDIIFKKKKLEQKNRIGLIILDSTLEIAFKEFLVNDSNITYSQQSINNLFENRIDVHKEVKKYIKLTKTLWKKIAYYYKLRCDLIHRRATGGITDHQIEDYMKVVKKVLENLFKLKFQN
ncbi:MAG: ATP-binding protein [DPANN group archaeon]|nr:ATP-binding protein [DPANN group archaeon]